MFHTLLRSCSSIISDTLLAKAWILLEFSPRMDKQIKVPYYVLMAFPVNLHNIITCFAICHLSYYSSGMNLIISFDNDCLFIEGKIEDHL